MKALVLSGGSIKGAWQAGAIETVIDSGYLADIITGTSVGSLNAAHLAAWPDDGKRLTDFWISHVKRPSDMARKRRWYELAYRALFNKWDGLLDMSPTMDLVSKTFKGKFPISNPFGQPAVEVASVDLHSGQLVFTPSTSPHFLDAVLASTAEPIVMPLRHVEGHPHYDGGLRDITPLAHAISMGATEIVAVICQPADVAVRDVKEGKVLDLTDRVMDILTNEINQNDIDTAQAINQLLADLPPEVLSHPFFDHKRVIPLTVIRPAFGIGVSLETDDPHAIRDMVEQGRGDAQLALVRAKKAA